MFNDIIHTTHRVWISIILVAETKAKEEKLKCRVCGNYSGRNTKNEGICKDDKDKGVTHTCPSHFKSCRKVVKGM